MKLQIEQIGALAIVDRDDWQQLDSAGNPFLQYDFLNGLEEYGCLDGHGWQPCHLLVRSGQQLLAALPLYLRDNSYGEFVFDWAWAEAYQRNGGHYYPKLVSAIPFTPVCGPRLLVRRDAAQPETLRRLLLEAMQKLVQETGVSSWHCLFTGEADQAGLGDSDLLLRKTIQYHWHNQGFDTFDHFLDSLTSKRRKQIRRERQQVAQQQVRIECRNGREISEQQWEIFYTFYCDTFHKRWGSPRLTLDFFKGLSDSMPEQTLLIMAKQGQDYVAGAFAMLDQHTLYGRHWGCGRELDKLHFELCYYQTIEYCIANGLGRMDAGVQGEHKINRGFQPVTAISGHLIRHPGFRQAIGDFLQAEGAETDRYVAALEAHSPYKQRQDCKT
ncbi:MAG: GNAT family N-acetyltransferase [Gammaproteobacteria bacterium]